MDNINRINDLEEIKSMWKDVNRRLENLERQTVEESRRMDTRKIRTAKEDLARNYKRFMYIGAVFGVMFPVFLITADHLYPSGTWKFISAGLFMIYFLTVAIMDGYLYNEVMGINLAEMTVKRVIERAKALKHRHHVFMMILIPMALVTIGVFCSQFLNDTFMMAGVCLGGLIGVLIGLKKYLQMMNDYREMMAQYSEED